MQEQNYQPMKVAVRIRPLNQRQIQLQSPICIERKDNSAIIHKDSDVKEFPYDYVFPMQTQQHQLYQSCVHNLVQDALEGFNATIMAYGQTATGKRFTMNGETNDQELFGVIPRVFQQVHRTISNQQSRIYKIQASYIDIYNEVVYDLLDNRQQRKIRQKPLNEVYIQDLKKVQVKSVKQMLECLITGDRNQLISATMMSRSTSRSHNVFTIFIESIDSKKGTTKTSKINMVRLSGSEKIGKTGATGQVLKQAVSIGKSLGSLGLVISALVNKNKHIPYRDSQITRLLQDSLGGNALTLIIANVSPAQYNYDETLSTLRFAYRAKGIKNKPKINEIQKKQESQENNNEGHTFQMIS